MAMKPAVVYATLIVGPNPLALAFMTSLVSAIQTMIKDASVQPTALVAPSGGGPVTGTGTIT